MNIQLDVTRNQLQKFEVTLTSATLFVRYVLRVFQIRRHTVLSLSW